MHLNRNSGRSSLGDRTLPSRGECVNGWLSRPCGDLNVLKHKIFNCLHRAAKLLEIELNVALGDVARPMIEQSLGRVIAQPIPEPAHDRCEGASQVVRRKRNAALGDDVDDLPMRIGDACACERIREYPFAVTGSTTLAQEILKVTAHRQAVIRSVFRVDRA